MSQDCDSIAPQMLHMSEACQDVLQTTAQDTCFSAITTFSHSFIEHPRSGHLFSE